MSITKEQRAADLKRAAEMLRVAAEYIRKHCPDSLIHYDETDCDGACVADDCEYAADDIDSLVQPAAQPPAAVEALRRCMEAMTALRTARRFQDDERTAAEVAADVDEQHARRVLAEIDKGEQA